MNTTDMPLAGHWELTIIMVVIASWILYKHMAPKNWKEWRNAGLIQAFIIALYAEMYGFPLTIYLLTSFLGIDIPWLHQKGHLWSTLLGLGDNGAMIQMFIGYTIIFAGLILVIKGWKAIYIVQKNDELVVDGIYQYMRHPQYTGIFVLLIGQIIHWPTILTLILFPVIVWAYYLLSRKEEKAMLLKFREAYRAYMERVSMYFPKHKNRSLFFAEI